jgi:hypothetical protein
MGRLLACACLCWAAGSSQARAQVADGPSWPLAAELHLSVLNDLADRSVLSGSFGYALRAGRRWDAWGAFLHIEHDLWVATEFELDVVRGAVNVGVGGEHLYHEGRVRTSIAVGPSILVSDTALDDAGSVGVFVDVRPVALRLPLSPQLALAVDPLTLTIVAPVLVGAALVRVEYRTAVYLEVELR